MSEIAVSLVIPVFNGAPFLAETLKRVRSWAEQNADPAEIIVVDDGSTDGTAAIAEDVHRAIPRYTVVHLPKNRGKGAAVRAGIKAAHGDCVVFTDADLPYGLKIIAAMRQRLHSHPESALVFGSRSNPLSESKGYGAVRRLGRSFFSAVVKLFAIPGVGDTQCGIKMLRRDLAALVASRGIIDRFAFDIELFAIARQNNFGIIDVPVMLKHRRESSVRFVMDTVIMLKDILRISLRMRHRYYVRD